MNQHGFYTGAQTGIGHGKRHRKWACSCVQMYRVGRSPMRLSVAKIPIPANDGRRGRS